MRVNPRGTRSARRVLGLLLLLAAGAWLYVASTASPVETGVAAPRPVCGGAPEDAATVAGGLLPAGATPLDGHLPGIANLDPALLSALRAASRRAARDGVRIEVNSGWRSREQQARLLCEAVARYGSAAEAERWVAPADASLHVTGDAVDVGPAPAASWLSVHGARFGLCRVYRNEPWHFELRTNAVEEGCPPLYRDAASDPRLEG